MQLQTHKNPTCSSVTIEGSYLRWDAILKSGTTLNTRFLEELANLSVDKEALANFFRQHGPLWNGNNIFIAKALSIIRTFQLLYWLKQSTKGRGQPRAAEELDKKFFLPLRGWRDKWEKSPLMKYIVLPAELDEDPILATSNATREVIKELMADRQPKTKPFKLKLMVAENGETQFLPCEPSPKVWPLFDAPPAFLTWEDKKAWLMKQLLRNAVSLLRRDLRLTLEGKESLRVVAHPANAYAWAVARLVLEKATRCAKCGSLASQGKYCSRKCEIASMSTGVKQSFLDYLNKQMKRGRIKPEDHVLIKETAGEYFDPDMTGEALKGKVVQVLGTEYPGMDLSSLGGFGSRKVTQKEELTNGRLLSKN